MIAFLINELDIRGGTHKQFLKLLEYTRSKTDDFFIVTKRVDFDKTYPGFKAFKDKIRVFTPTVQHSRIKRFLNRAKYRSEIKEVLKDADCINIHDQGYEFYLPALKDKKIVWQVNDLPGCFAVGNAKNAKIDWKTRIIKFFIKRAAKVVDVFTVNVTKNAERISKAFKRDAQVLYCGIEAVGLKHNEAESLERFKKKQINLLSSGVFFPYRNYETQIEVVKILKEKGWKIKLNIIGSTELDKEYSRHIKDLIKQQGLEGEINVCGQVNENEFRELHLNSDIFLFINIDQSWGLAVFEAMSCGIPVIVSESVGAT
ncbi:MAG: glycosyltransferase, partial [Paramuribaculum sp.]|nr:glycosyltransferase [Paramuribaculum sp.]